MAPVRNGGNHDWLVSYKKRIIVGIVAILSVGITVTMVFISLTMRTRLIEESRRRAAELGTALHTSLTSLMQVRSPGRMQSTLVSLAREDPAIVRIFILDNRGRIAYSSTPGDVGAVVDRFADPSCLGCHRETSAVAYDTTMTLAVGGAQVLRHVHTIVNEKPCQRCHHQQDRINGKLIIDQSFSRTEGLIRTVNLIIGGLGLACLAVLLPFLWRFLSRGVDTYIAEIRLKSAELKMLYTAVERLSATIELDELKHIIIDLVAEALQADEVDLVLPSEHRDSGAIALERIGQKVDRKKIIPGSALDWIIRRWNEGGISDHEIAPDGATVCMPITKGGNRLALVVASADRGAFNASRLPLVRALAHHIVVAFENATLYQIAITDELTGLYSNRHFRQMIMRRHAAFRQFGEKTTLLMADIDDFKKVNDTYGHPVGDAILKDVSSCIMSSVRGDDMAFRYGGEEFAIILPATDIPGALIAAERLRALIEHYPFKADQHVLKVTVSIGLASWPASADDIRTLINEADQALYSAKRDGKNRVAVRTKGTGEGVSRGSS
jgi:diguanylate cyclase (GGDEF)-like protein